MARERRVQAGFTLIETILVMAISSMLVAAGMMGFSAWRMQIQFADSVDGLKEMMTALRTESQASINTGAAPGQDPAMVNFGRILTFTPGSSAIRVDILRTANTTAPASTQVVQIVRTETRQIKWGVTYTGPTRSVAFTQALPTGRLQTAWRNNWNLGALRYGDFVPSTSVVALPLQDPAGRTGTIRIDPVSNGVTRSIP